MEAPIGRATLEARPKVILMRVTLLVIDTLVTGARGAECQEGNCEEVANQGGPSKRPG